MPIQIRHVGHVVLKVRDRERSAKFYRDVLGLTEVARLGGRMAFFTATGDALKIGDRREDLVAAKAHLQAHGVRIAGIMDHRVSRSIYLDDPDGNGLELYVDAEPAVWRTDPASVAYAEPMEL